jgi:hypothetical protein
VRAAGDTLRFFSQNVDAWGALEWFDRLAKAVRQQDAAVVAGNMLEFDTCRNVAASSAMRLVRDYEHEVCAALSRTPAMVAEHSDKDRQLTDLRVTAEAFRVAMIESGAIVKVSQDQYIDQLRALERALEPLNYIQKPGKGS